ncbi:MAG: hypothetical protein L6Q29_02020 [Candidatus Pacebacteria bacterium]|nr:hypothetical protein [Candidatus Paceibacterota bacterium]NUQ56961.1 hypothetical protein [Candidatus Paceibacter sp.]
MDFFAIFDEKAEKDDWFNFFLDLIGFLENGQFKWRSDDNKKIRDSYIADIPSDNINGGVKIIVSVISCDADINCHISVEHHEDINPMSIYCFMEGGKAEIFGFYKLNKYIKTVIADKSKKELIEKRIRSFYNKLINSRLARST